MEINTTPLIDVMLVLLIMFIITIPLQSHSVEVDLPKAAPGIVNPLRNTLVISASGALMWNGEAVSDDRLRSTLAASQATLPIPELHLKPEAQARYERVDEVLAMTKQAHVARMGFVGNDAYRQF
jgi:biopolymer transport protein ExbD